MHYACKLPPTIYCAKMSMNAAEAIYTAGLLGKPALANPYLYHGLGEVAQRLISLALDAPDLGHVSDMTATDAWASALAVSGWMMWDVFDEV